MANTFTSVDIAISIASELGLFFVPGAKVPGDGNCLFLALITQAIFFLSFYFLVKKMHSPPLFIILPYLFIYLDGGKMCSLWTT